MRMKRADQFRVLRGLRIPDSGGARGGVQKAVLRCIDDHAGEGGKCWASVPTLAAESCFSIRTVIRALADLVAAGLLTAEHRSGRPAVYQIQWDNAANLRQTVTPVRESPLPESHPTPVRESGVPLSESPKPLPESHPKHKKPTGNQNETLKLRASQFEEFWKAYPPRNGRRLNKKDAATQFAKLKDAEIPDVMRAVKQYAAEGQIPKDAFRWLNSSWREWLESPVAMGTAAADDLDDLDGLAADDIGPRRTA